MAVNAKLLQPGEPLFRVPHHRGGKIVYGIALFTDKMVMWTAVGLVPVEGTAAVNFSDQALFCQNKQITVDGSQA